MVLFFTHIPFVVNHTINANHRRGCNNTPSFLQRTAPIARSLCEGWTRHDLHILVTAPFYCDRKSRAPCAQSFAPWQQTTIKIMIAISLTVACSRYVFNGVILHAYPVRGESHNQRNTTGEVATTDYHMQMRWLKRNENNIFQQSKTILKLKHGLSGGPVFTSSFSLPPSSFATVWQWLLIFHANF